RSNIIPRRRPDRTIPATCSLVFVNWSKLFRAMVPTLSIESSPRKKRNPTNPDAISSNFESSGHR
ncbi:MAG: hypothetical protein JWM69_1185, partial [Candidatus Binatus sp.]|nr:hypothetical protein [Candidatus Binatus sp.]